MDDERILGLADDMTGALEIGERIEGHSERATAAEVEWREKSKSIPASERKLRRLEFVIQETSKYDKAVGTHVNILALAQMLHEDSGSCRKNGRNYTVTPARNPFQQPTTRGAVVVWGRPRSPLPASSDDPIVS